MKAAASTLDMPGKPGAPTTIASYMPPAQASDEIIDPLNTPESSPLVNIIRCSHLKSSEYLWQLVKGGCTPPPYSHHTACQDTHPSACRSEWTCKVDMHAVNLDRTTPNWTEQLQNGGAVSGACLPRRREMKLIIILAGYA